MARATDIARTALVSTRDGAHRVAIVNTQLDAVAEHPTEAQEIELKLYEGADDTAGIRLELHNGAELWRVMWVREAAQAADLRMQTDSGQVVSITGRWDDATGRPSLCLSSTTKVIRLRDALGVIYDVKPTDDLRMCHPVSADQASTALDSTVIGQLLVTVSTDGHLCAAKNII